MGDPYVRPGLVYKPHIEKHVLKHDGTGTEKMSPEEWAESHYRDSLSTVAQRYDLLTYVSVGHGVCTARMKRQLLEKMVDPLGLRERERTREDTGHSKSHQSNGKRQRE
eukprot:Tbor_TRINITY_DN5417_c3_g1::TRINITY_DN5417_c3_g1_i1::g.24991::m.24991/K12832/SF3B5, SF3B10; splicing factor 3B subunit 5